MPSLPTTSQTWIVASKPSGEITDVNDVFQRKEKTLPELKEGEILVATRYFSNDPAMRTWCKAGLDPKRAYGPVINEGDVMPAGVLGEVLASKSDKFAVGDFAQGFHGWADFFVASAEGLNNVKPIEGQSPAIALSLLGLTGLTAWCGLHEVGQVKKDNTVVISAAAGATGSVAVQIAKNLVGCKKVIGIAGGADKCRWVESLGADVCVDYKSASFKEDLIKATEDGVDVYFDNVGGETLNIMFGQMNRFSRIIACGAISTYNSKSDIVNLSNFFEVISMRITVQGFIVTDYMSKAGEIVAELRQAIEDGKIQTENSETIKEARFDQIPSTFMMLFDGTSKHGKLITKLI